MGKVEKVIVLSVLFLIALILVVSLTVDDPLNKARVVEAGAPANRNNATPIIPAPETGVAGLNVVKDPSGLLSSQIAPATEPVVLQAAPVNPAPSDVPTAAPTRPVPAANELPLSVIPSPSLPAGALLKKLDGLQDSILPDMKLYTWKEGDSYKLIANNYYGNWQKLTVLKRSNEGRTDVKPGQTIFVPVFDTDVAPIAKPDTAPKGDKSVSAKQVSANGARIHIVKEGESLWKIAKLELGNGDRWKEIYELNREVLAKPEAVHKGQRLRIP